MLKYISVLLFVILNFSDVFGDKNKYGTFNLTLTGADKCRGPKHKDCATMQVEISDHNILYYDVNVTQNVILTKGKIIAMTKGKEYIRFQLKKPCEHLFLKPILYAIYNITKDCAISKGRYQYNVDVQKITQSYYGGNFLLGNWTFRSLFYSDECNFYCLDIKVQLF
ncbi:uncharacterized protein LOC118265218 [Spodoptera frugiperda]|uniref:Uncharacterized protein LOC118265218 n=1 Tax=Spodoptera frugiperda TaxID=7108 RepID=A0A9R0CYJ6_SPOFR|nr:uncharacterized protein LOC118265218 [Spodoptera frugiperda]